MNNLQLLALEGIDPGHVASNLVIPIAIGIFGGAMFALLWSNYGAKKGGLILGVAMFGFMGFIGVFWWFGAPGTPVATGPQNLPGQAADEYQPAWFPFEPGSPRSEFFGVTNTPGDFVPVEDFVGTSDEADPQFNATRGDLESVQSLMLEQYYPTNADGFPLIGANRRAEIQGNTPDPEEGFARPVYTARVATEDGRGQAFLTLSEGIRLAMAELEVVATYSPATDDDGLVIDDTLEAYEVVVEESMWFAFKDPGAIWLPSAIWTALSFLLFGLCLFGLDRMEQREKREDAEVEEPLDVEVPIAQ